MPQFLPCGYICIGALVSADPCGQARAFICTLGGQKSTLGVISYALLTFII